MTTAYIVRERRCRKPDSRLLEVELRDGTKLVAHIRVRTLGVLVADAHHRDGTALAAALYPPVSAAVREYVTTQERLPAGGDAA